VTSLVWRPGATEPEAEALVPADDPGLLVGHGVFETCKVVDGVPFALTRHLARLRRSAALVAVDVPWTDPELRAATAHALAATPGGRLRITVTAGAGRAGAIGGTDRPDPDDHADRTGPADRSDPDDDADRPEPAGGARGRLVVTVGPARAWPATAAVVVSPWRVDEHGPLAGAKTISHLPYVLALADARRRGADEAVLTNTAGAVCEASSANLFVVVDGRLCTPALRTGCLPGVTRDLVCALVDVDERDDLTVAHLRDAPEAFLTSSTRDAQPIASVDGAALATAPGPRTAEAAAAFTALATTDLDP
jgi:branched-chain amino acid aminotransferase